jgi:hypothetical protein
MNSKKSLMKIRFAVWGVFFLSWLGFLLWFALSKWNNFTALTLMWVSVFGMWASMAIR